MGTFEVLLRTVDITALWLLFYSDNKYAQKRTLYFGLLSLFVFLISMYYIYLLNSARVFDYYTFAMLGMQLTFFASTFALLLVNDESTENQLKYARKTFLVWVSVMVMIEQFFIVYAIATSGNDYKSSSSSYK